MERKKGLCQEALKGIACVTMLMDHYAVVIHYSLWLRVVGRLAFPIYCFLISEGMAHTHNEKKYLGRLLVMALLSEAVYDWVLYPGDSIWAHQNVLWTLLLGAAMIACMKRAGESPWRIGLMVPFALAAEGLGSSYGGWGIVMIALFWLTRGAPRGNWLRLAGLAVINWSISSMHMSLLGLKVPVQAFGVLLPGTQPQGEPCMRKHLSTIVLLFILLIGLSLLLYPTVSDYWNSFHQTKAITTYAENVAALDQASYEALWEAARAYNKELLSRNSGYALSEEQQAEYKSLLDISGQGVMGYIEIPEIDVSLPIYHGTEDSVLQVAVGHL